MNEKTALLKSNIYPEMIWVSWHCVSKREPWLPLVSYTQHPYKSAWVHDAPSNVTRTKLMFLMQLVILSPYCWMFEPRRAICGEITDSDTIQLKALCSYQLTEDQGGKLSIDTLLQLTIWQNLLSACCNYRRTQVPPIFRWQISWPLL